MSGKIQKIFSNDWKITAGLALITLVLFLPSVRYGHIAFDDDVYVFENQNVITGLSPANIRWALAAVHEQYWLPVLRLSFMADASIFGPSPWGFHLTNILLHIANVLLLFGLLLRFTGARWPSAFVAALFAIHPLNVEAVVWITARKDVLSTFFWLLGLWAYIRYVDKPVLKRYALVFLLMLLGLMSKANVVAMPFTLLLLDYWPLRRGADATAWRRLVLEKWALFALSAVFVAINLLTHTSGAGAGVGLPWSTRLALIPANYADYVGKVFMPTRLSILYPENDVIRWGNLLAATVGLGLFTYGVLQAGKKFPFLVVGWGWFLITLFPVVRGVRLGLAAMADRYAYIPGIGIFLLLAWGGAELVRVRPKWESAILAAAVASLLAAGWLAAAQIRVWSKPEWLFEQAVTRGEHVVSLGHLASLLDEAGRTEEALALYSRALQLLPDDAATHSNIARIYTQMGRTEEAFRHYRRALELKPDLHGAWINMGLLYQSQRNFVEAEECFKEALKYDPVNYMAHNNLGAMYALTGRMSDAVDCFARALEIAPHRDDIRANYERALKRQ